MMSPVLTTMRRRLLSLLPHCGLRVIDVSPGAAFVCRTGTRLAMSQMSPGTSLVLQRSMSRRHRHDQDKALSNYLATEQIMHVLSLYKVNCVLDVGANKGQYAQSLRRAGYKGWIVSFEPVPRDHEVLAERAATDARWTTHPIALGREDGSIAMNVVPGTLSSLLPPTSFGSTRYERLQAPAVQQVDVRRLDGVLDDVTAHVPNPRLYLKLDTQGFDVEAFAGLGSRAQDLVGMQSEVALLKIYEAMPRMMEAVQAYEAAGFEITGLYPVSRERRTARVLEFDCIMARPDAR
jgi:FkbM family methyltransferase